MQSKLVFFFCVLFTISSCNLRNDINKKDTDKQTNHELSIENSCDSEQEEKISVFSECKNYNNNLSTIASEVKFVHLSAEPPINDFLTYDVQVAEEYIFLADLYNIRQYDLQGNYIQNIGSRGMGPKEYVQLKPPIQLDRKNRLIYASDSRQRRIIAYHFDGKYKGSFSIKYSDGCIAIIDSTTIALRQTMAERWLPDCPLIRYIDYEGRIKKDYPSRLYPYLGEKTNLGSMESYLWEHGDRFYYLEYGSDIIYRIAGDSIIPVRKLTGKLKLKPYDFFFYQIGDKLNTLAYIAHPNSTIFESDGNIVFRLENQRERFFMVYNKITKTFHRTRHANAPVFSSRDRGDVKRMDYFTDDTVSGLRFDPQYQSMGKAIALIPATEVVEKRDEILSFISSHPTSEGDSLKSVIENITEYDNALIMIVTFK